MIKRLSILFVLYFLLHLPGFGQKRKAYPAEKPKLVVGIVIDQMRYDYLYRYWDKFGENGFKKLVNMGTICKDASFEHQFLVSGSGHASISTGTTPHYHGIISNDWYDRLNDRTVYCVEDNNVSPVGTESAEGMVSPRNLLVTNLGDELKLSNQGKSKVISISLKDRSSILMAGHIADAAYWMENKTGNWISSSHYMDSLPMWVKEFNSKKLQDLYLDRSWNTSLPIEQYTESLSDKNDYEKGILRQISFPYDLAKLFNKLKSYDLLKSTPFGNTITKDFAIAAIINEELGMDDYTDLLSVSFSSSDFVGHEYGPMSVEMEDTYLRLDKELAHFLESIDEIIGKENTLIFLTADHGAVNVPEYLSDLGISAGYFDHRKAINLLSAYLNAVYGNGKWIQTFISGQIYLDRNLIEDSKISLKEIQEKTAGFITQFTGVANALPASYLEYGNYTNGVFEKMQKNYNQKRAGDVFVNLEPGWLYSTTSATSHFTGYQYDAHVPLIWYGWKIKRGTVLRKVSICDIAPTISNFLNISFPSGCTGEIIYELSE